MAEDDVEEATNDAGVKTEDGDGGKEADNEASLDEPVEEAVNGKDSLTPYRATKIAGIAVGAALVCAVIVVGAVWAIAAIFDDDDDFRGDRFQYASRSAFDDDVYRAQERDYGRGPLADESRWTRPSRDHFSRPGFGRRNGAHVPPFGFDASGGPVVVLVVPGLGLGDWGDRGDFNLGELGGEPRDLLSLILPFLESGGWLDGEAESGARALESLFDEWNLEVPQLQGDLSLQAHELDNEVTPGLEGLT